MVPCSVQSSGDYYTLDSGQLVMVDLPLTYAAYNNLHILYIIRNQNIYPSKKYLTKDNTEPELNKKSLG